MKEFPHSKDQIYEMFDQAVQHECEWTNYIIGNNVLGISDKTTEIYTKHIANVRLRAVGLEPIYSGEEYKKNPYAHLERFADVEAEGTTKANFFEATVTSYNMRTSILGWDDF